MPIPTTIDFVQIRHDNNLATTIQKYLGLPQRGKWLCPFHKEKSPSFTVRGDRFKCFGCGINGDVVDFVARMEGTTIKETAQKLGGYLWDLGLSQAEIERRRAEIRAEYLKQELDRKADEAERRQTALAKVARLAARVDWYHSQVEQARAYWRSQGIDDANIEYFKLGYAPKCPTFPDTASYVIPYFHQGNLVSIRHRLKGREKDKYRPEFAGLPNQLFNLDTLDQLDFSILESGEVVLCEGEVKAMVLTQLSIPAVGLPGAQAWQEEWLALFRETETVYIVLDPDAESKAEEITRTFNGSGIKAKNVVLTCKPDDFFVKFGGDIDTFLRILEQGRRVV